MKGLLGVGLRARPGHLVCDAASQWLLFGPDAGMADAVVPLLVPLGLGRTRRHLHRRGDIRTMAPAQKEWCLRGRQKFGFNFAVPVLPMAVLALAVAACREDRPPWRPDEVLREVETELRRFDGVTGDFVEVHLLMWQIEEGPTRGRLVEEALLWARNRLWDGTETWALIHAYRDPASDNAWHRSVSYIRTKNEALVPHTRLGYRRFKAPPSAADICGFLQHVRGLGVPSDVRHVSGGFPVRTWRVLTGQKPPCGFTGA